MKRKSFNFLKKFVETPSPSGYEMPAAKVFREYIDQFCRKTETDIMGSVWGVIGEADASPRVMLAGHMDELGLMITHIDESGFLWYKTVGGIDAHTVPGSRVKIRTKNGDVFGVMGRRALHIIEPKDRGAVAPHNVNFVDIGAKNKKEAEKLVEKGDVAVFDVGFERLRGDLCTSRAFDDKCGAWVVAETLRLLAKKKKNFQAEVFGCATVQEEVGLRGATTAAFNIRPDIGVAVDVGFANDHPGADAKRYGDARLGSGPIICRGPNINHKMFDLFVKAAKKNKIPTQIEAHASGTGTDANVIQLSRGGVATMLISIPLRYMHTQVETLNLKDLSNAAKLIAAFIMELKSNMSFVLKE